MNSSIRQSSMKHECSRTTYWLRLLCGGSLATSKRCIREKRGCSSQYIFGFRSARFPAIKVYPLLSALTRSTGPSWCFLISDKTDYQRSGAFSAGSRGRSAGQPIGGARSAHKLTSQLDHSVRADQSLSAAGTKNPSGQYSMPHKLTFQLDHSVGAGQHANAVNRFTTTARKPPSAV